jgi:hypothetical protein
MNDPYEFIIHIYDGSYGSHEGKGAMYGFDTCRNGSLTAFRIQKQYAVGNGSTLLGGLRQQAFDLR